jgi:hypothetical protein
MSGYETPSPENEVAPDVAVHPGGDRPAGDVDDPQDVASGDKSSTPQDPRGTEVPPTRENLRLT